MPGETTYQCTYAEGCQIGRRHVHPYTLTFWGAKRCTCGNRRWQVTTGQLLTPEVGCDKCRKRNYSATAYEAGRRDGRREVLDALAAIPGTTPKVPF